MGALQAILAWLGAVFEKTWPFLRDSLLVLAGREYQKRVQERNYYEAKAKRAEKAKQKVLVVSRIRREVSRNSVAGAVPDRLLQHYVDNPESD